MKNSSKRKSPDRKPLSDEMLSALERDLGVKGRLDITIATEDPSTGKTVTHYHYSNKLSKLKLRAGHELSVAVSSIDQENQELLHFLLRRV